MYNFASIVDHNAEVRPDTLAVTEGNRRVTHAELRDRVNALATALSDNGIRRGQIIGVLMYNHIEYLDIMMAANRLGASIVPLNYRLSPQEWRFILEHSGAVAILTEDEFVTAVDELRANLPEMSLHVTVDEPAGPEWVAYRDLVAPYHGARCSLVDVNPDELQRLMYTSGTTSRPKGVQISHENLLWKNFAHILEFGLTEKDSTLICGPMYHVGGMDLPGLATLHAGGTLHIVVKFEPTTVLTAIESLRPSVVWLAPAMMNALLHVPDVHTRDMASLRIITGGGEKMPEPLYEHISKVFPTTWFADAYGLTETVSGDCVNDAQHSRTKLGSVGRPMPHTQIRVVADDGSVAGTDELGEIVIKGPKVTRGYWKDPEATAKAIRDGWFHTGDIGRIDADGYLFIEDRKKDMIVSGGENIATPEVERVLYENDDVIEAAVLGVSHPKWGEVPKAYVVRKANSSLTAAALQDFVRARLAKYKVPAEIVFVDALPRTPSGKVLKRVLREQK
ncbi:acyl-CoA synthetase [Gordonia insulae]|uniref:Long-chain-fatty-acid--CoA ligase n=1 Tax=Gordonia insulae TaxID=2420509 RepID=A0A3G8JLK8_9ACTN|nr:long-chain fatty acid--CoA ligase [Gordonia insulae]AZG45956.1 Long-chain-fatty-acid--CoA ligase [Gordonia insulae]